MVPEDLEMEESGGDQSQVATEGTARRWWIGSTARQGREGRGVIGHIQRQLHEWWSNKTNTRRRENYWVMQIFSEHNKVADAWAEKAARGERNNWALEGGVEWQDVRGSMHSGTVRVKVFTRAPGWHTVNNTCELVTKADALDAEIRVSEI